MRTFPQLLTAFLHAFLLRYVRTAGRPPGKEPPAVTNPYSYRNLRSLLAGVALFCLLLPGCATDEQVVFSRGQEQLRQLKYAQAYDTFTWCILLVPGSPEAYYNRALSAVGLDKLNQGLADLDEAVRLDPVNMDARWMRFKIRAALREAARADSTISAELRPVKLNVESALTVCMMNELDGIIKIVPDDIWALNERGRMKHDQGDFEGAIADYNSALVSCDTCTWLMYNKALSLRACWRTREALAVLEELVRADGTDGEAWLLLGECHFALGKRREACDAFRRAIELGVAEAEERYKTLCR